MKIVVLDGGTLNPGDLSWSSMKKHFGEITTFDQTPSDKIIERSIKADILVINKVVIDKEVIDQLPNLKYVAVSATGYNNIDVSACREKGILVSNISNYGSSTVAQHVFALLLALTNRVEKHHQLVKDGEWKNRNVFSFWTNSIIDLEGKTLGVIGWGNIGQKAGQIANGFGMKVIYHSSQYHQSSFAEAVDLDQLITTSDVISLNTHLTEDKYNMVNSAFLKKMKPTAYLINTSRGGLVNEIDLAAALKNESIAGAGLDVLKEEPASANHPLLKLDNCIITPHNAWASLAARQRLMTLLEENIQSFIDGHPQNLIN